MLQASKNRLYRLLRWSERYTRLDMVYFASGSFWQTFGQAGSAALSFILVLIFANLLPKETYGLYKYILSLAGILNIFTLTGMNQAVAQAVATGDEGTFRTSVTYQLKWGTVATGAFWVVSAYYLLHGNTQLGVPLAVLGIFWPLTAAFNTYSAYLGAKKDFRLNNIFSVISTIIYVGGTALSIVLSGDVIWIVVAYALTTFAANLLFYYATIRRFKPPATAAHTALTYGRQLTFINVMSTVVSQIDSVILNHFWGPAQLAVYSVALAIPNRAIPFFKSPVETSFPKLAAKTPQEINQVFYRRILYGLGAGVVVAIAYIFAAPYLFAYLLPQYLDAVLYTQILATGFVFALPNRYLALLFTAQKMSRVIFFNTLFQNIIRILLYVVLGIWLGIIGLVMAQAASTFLNMVINIIAWRWKSAQF